MSAYICNPEHLGILAAYAVLNDCAVHEWQHTRKNTLEAKIDTAQRVAKGLARENIRSVATRYPNDVDGSRPGPGLKDAEIEEAAAIYAAHFVVHPQRLKPIQILKLSRSLDYQSCETDDWKDTLAWRQLDWINGNAIRDLPGYENADWSFDQPLPEIVALYQNV
jgi:hypothetical protein